MNRRSFAQQRWWPWLLLAALTGALLYWWYFLLEREEYEIDLGFSEQARRNPFLAAEHLLQARGHEVQVLRTFAALDSMSYQGDAIAPDDVVILVNAYRQLQGQRLENVWEWLNAGGSLVLSARNAFIASDLEGEGKLLSRLPLSVVAEAVGADDDPLPVRRGWFAPDENQTGEAESGEEEQNDEKTTNADEKPTQAADEAVAADAAPEPAVTCDHLEQSAQIANRTGPNFEIARVGPAPFQFHGNTRLQWGEVQGPHQLLQFAQGTGTVTANADNRIWNNTNIGCFDHAYALALLAQDKGKVWILINVDAPSLWRLLWVNLPLMVVLLSLALALWLWAKAKRFAPVAMTQLPGRRSFLEHLQASAVFLWRHKQGPVLLRQLREDITTLLDNRHPGATHLDSAERNAFIGTLSGLTPDEVTEVLEGDLPATPTQFTAAVQRLQIIRKHL